MLRKKKKKKHLESMSTIPAMLPISRSSLLQLLSVDSSTDIVDISSSKAFPNRPA
jgi:hypothetical protein